MRELAEWHASRHDPPVQGDPVLGRSGEIITFHWCLGQWLGVGWCSNLLFEKLLHCYSPVESLWRAWSVHMGISRAHTFVFVCISSGIAVDKTLLNLQHDSTLQLTGLGIWCRTAGSQRSFCYVANLRRVVVKSLVLNCCVLWHLVAVAHLCLSTWRVFSPPSTSLARQIFIVLSAMLVKRPQGLFKHMFK